MGAAWTASDEASLQSAREDVVFWSRLLKKSQNATSLREGNRARVEYRKLIRRAENDIARLLARKEAAKEAA